MLMNVSIDRLAGSSCTEAEARPLEHPLPGVVTEEERTLLGIRQARDLVLAKNRELIDKLARAEDEIAELTYQRDDYMVARDVALRKAADSEAEVAQLRVQFDQLSEQQAALGEAEKIYVLARSEIEADLAALATERDQAVEARRIDAIEMKKLRSELETLQAAAGKTEASAPQLEETLRQLAETREEHERFSAQQKKFVAALAEQLSDAQRTNQDHRRQIEHLENERDALQKHLDEGKAAPSPNASASSAKLPGPDGRSRVTHLPGPPPPPHPTPAVTPISDQEIRDAIGALIVELEAVKEQPGKPEPLAAFAAGLHAFAERTLDCGVDLIHHLTSTSADFARRLGTTPNRVSASLITFDHAIEMLGWLGLRGRAEMLNTSGALVYAVDDDLDNCECLATAFEKVALQTKYSVRPDVALEQIASLACELIILDVDLPGMDGFELHAHIRKMPAHATTPIIFLSGHLSTIERLDALGEDNNEFVAKPYNLSELSVRVLTRIVEARLG